MLADLGDAFAGFLLICGLALVAVGALFIFVILGTAVGAFTGWIVSLTPLGGLVEHGFELFGFNVKGFLMQVGAMLGFIGGFLKGIASSKKED